MLRSLLRPGVAALFVLSLAVPAQALPLAGEREGFTLSLSALWEGVVGPLVIFWTEGTPGNEGKSTTDGEGDTRNICDPNGGDCES